MNYSQGQKTFRIIGALVTWFAVLMQCYLMLGNSENTRGETTIRIFSYYTTLTNLLLAVYFTISIIPGNPRLKMVFQQRGTSTALMVYITVVCLVYQMVLRSAWSTDGIDQVVNELLHTIIPAFFFVYWILYASTSSNKVNQLWFWLIYPLIYFISIITRGSLSGFYPYPFINIDALGLQKVIINCLGLTFFFIVISLTYILLPKLISKEEK